MNSRTTIFPARKIITMFPEAPYAKAIAVKDGRILAVGEMEDVKYSIENSQFAQYDVNPIFQDKVLMPGLVDAHTHVDLQALIYSGRFVAQIPWPRPEGGFYPIYPTKKDVLNRLKELDKELPPGELLYAAAYDENKTGEFLHIKELDEVSTTRPILVSNLVFHRFWANSYTLEKAGIDLNNLPDGVEAGPDGRPNGTLIESTGLMAILPVTLSILDIGDDDIKRTFSLFYSGGVTTATEAAFGAFGLQNAFTKYSSLLDHPDVNLRMVGFPWAKSGIKAAGSMEQFADQVQSLAKQNTDKMRIGPIKLYTDGSIVSRTSPIGWPGYWDGTPEPSMENDPKLINELLIYFHERGMSTVTHANSRPGCQVVLDAVREAQSRNFRPDMRHRIEHAYNISEAQLRLAKELGVCIQFFTPQIYYYGDTHVKLQGLDRSRNITPTGTAKRLGVSWGFHNDPPGTPQLPWVGAWATVHRLTMEKGVVLGPNQRVGVEDALRAMTIEAAYQLHLDHEVGSIEFGKKADFCVLEADPLEIDPMELKDIPVWGTVFGGKLNPAN